MYIRAAGLLAALAGLWVTASAQATPLPPNFLADAIADFNVITNGNFSQNNDTQGPILVGGNLITSGHPINDVQGVPLPKPIAGLGEVNVFGNVTGTVNNSVGSGSVVLVGGTTASAVTFSGKGAGSVLNGNLFPYSFSDIWAQFTGMSSSLAALTPTSSITTTTINGVANADGVAVLTVPLSTLNSLTGTLSFTGCLALNLTTPCDGVILVTNTDTSNTTFKNSSLSDGALTSAQKNLIWVFEPPSGGVGGITQVDISGEWWASILAVGADVENTAPIVGNTIANTVDASGGNGEFHIPQFDCSDNLCGSLAPPPPMPEPGSLALLATGLAGAAFVGWRRRRNTTPALP